MAVYLCGCVHVSTRLTNANKAAKVSTVIVNLSGNEFPQAYATIYVTINIINDTPKKVADSLII